MTTNSNDLTVNSSLESTQQTALGQAGAAANRVRAAHIFAEYRSRKAANTLKAQDTDLARFAGFLEETTGIVPAGLNQNPQAWAGITGGLLAAFVQWQLQRGYAVSSVNRSLATVRRYAGLAFQAGVLSTAEHALMQAESAYSETEAKRVDERREVQRVGEKKAEHTRLSDAEIMRLKSEHEDTPQGRRDRVLMTLLLELGLRCSEVAGLAVESVDWEAGQLTFYRPKVDKWQTHHLMPQSRAALTAYRQDMLNEPDAPLLRGSRKSGALTDGGMSVRAVMKRVRELGKRIGVETLSPHDCRHAWATLAARAGTDAFALQEAGGWNSLAMPRRYVQAAEIANEGVKLA